MPSISPFFHREPHPGGIIAADDLEFRAEQSVQDFRIDAGPSIDSRGSDNDLPFGRVIEGFYRDGVPIDTDRLHLVGAADPFEFARVVMGDGRSIERQNQGDVGAGENSRTVLRGTVENEIRAFHARGSRHVLNNEIGTSWQVARHVAGNQPGEYIVTPARSRTHIHG